MVKNVLADGAPPWTPLGSLQRSARPPSWTNGAGGGKREEETKETGDGEDRMCWKEIADG